MFKKRSAVLKKARDLIVHSDNKSPEAEQYRTIRTSIQYSSVDKDMQTVIFTSASPGEGKSTTASNIAITFANQGKKTLIIDADLRKPVLHYTFGVETFYGLTNAILKEKRLEDCIYKTGIENLSLLPSGQIPPNPSELLGSQNMKVIVDTLKENYDVLIFDTPPILAVTDAKVLANICDGIVLVLKSDYTTLEAAKKAVTLLDGSKARLIGSVLNGKKATSNDYMYYSHYL